VVVDCAAIVRWSDSSVLTIGCVAKESRYADHIGLLRCRRCTRERWLRGTGWARVVKEAGPRSLRTSESYAWAGVCTTRRAIRIPEAGSYAP
jgi:hypothetical protein